MFTCLYCNSHQSEVYLSGCRDDYRGTFGIFDYFRCKSCGLVQISPIPQDIGALYESYPIHQQKTVAHQLMRNLLMKKGYLFIKPASVGQKLLDFGCGDGWYFTQMSKDGWQAHGFEFGDIHAAKLSKASGLPVFHDLEKLIKDNHGIYDLVTMNYVLEHLPTLRNYFETVRNLLKVGGHFYFSVPNIGCIESKLFGRKWHGLDPPRHISFVNDDIVSALALQNGFITVSQKTVGMPNITSGSLATVLSGRFNFPLFALLIPFSAFFCLLVRTNTLCYLLKKR